MRYVKVETSQASSVISELMERNVVDRSIKILKDNDFRYIPVHEDVENTLKNEGFILADREQYVRSRKSPQDRIRSALSDLPDDVLNALPMRWEYVGDIVILKTNIKGHEHRMGEVYAKELGVKTVCIDRSGVSGEFRRPSMEIIFGSDTESVRLENGIRYMFDVTKVMFASGNNDERERMKRLNCTGETVVDMFAGIGYFTLPVAKFTGASKVIACEKNSDSFHYLKKNIELNSLDNVEPVFGDNRELECNGIADRVIMGYVQRTSEFLDKALSILRPGGVIHYHDTFYVNEFRERINKIFASACDEFEILCIKEVKSFAPSVSHYVADVRI